MSVSLKTLRGRIASVKNTRKITKAMELMAAVRVRNMKKKVEEAELYGQRIKILARILKQACEEKRVELQEFNISDCLSSSIIKEGENEKIIYSQYQHLVIIFSSERGLCGGFNIGLFNQIKELRNRLAGNFHFICIGKKSYDYLLKHKLPSDSAQVLHLSGAVTNLDFAYNYEHLIVPIFKQLRGGPGATCHIIYSHFISSMQHSIRLVQLQPLQFENDSFVSFEHHHHNHDQPREEFEVAELTFSSTHDYKIEIEPELAKSMKAFLPSYYASLLFHARLNSLLGEESMRMIAMKGATDNADGVLEELTSLYNLSRQDEITTELIEIISGVEAMEEN